MESKVKKYRIEKGLTQAKLAKLAKVDVMKISNIERGKVKEGNISVRVCYQIAKALGVSMEDLVPDSIK